MHQDAPITPAGTERTAGDVGVPVGTTRPAAPARRTVMRMGAAAGIGVVATAGLAACGSGSDTGTAGAAGETAGAAAPPSDDGAAASSGGAAAGGALAKVSDVPVGGSYAAAGPDGKPIVIAQPEAGKIVAFSAACTHQGCKVTPEGKTLKCPCHASIFDAFTGKNLSGPAPRPLPPVAVQVSGTDVVAG